MISSLASNITQKLIRTGAIGEDDGELYIYGFFVLLSYVFSFCIAIIAGIMFGVLFDSIILCIMFVILRGYAGGFHSKSESRCTVCTITALFLSAMCIRLLHIADTPFIAIAVLCGGGLNVALLSPIDTPEKPLTKEERQHYGKLTRLCLVAIFLVSVISILFHRNGILYASTVCVSLESVLLWSSRIFHRTSE